MTTSSRRRRVPAMAPEERRAALIAATVPLMCAQGMAVTTRQIAEAAGVAEGTIFGVFPDKASLLRAAVLAAFDPEPLVEALHALAPERDLRARLGSVVGLLRKRFADNEPMIAATRTVASEPDQKREFLERMTHARRCTIEVIAEAFEPDRELLRRDPRSAARLLLMMIMATAHAGFGDERDALSDLDDDEIVSLLLDGLLVRPAPTGGTR
jgi:AcrR family transcriptional regulator